MMTPTSRFGSGSVRANAIKNGWRSGLEETLAADLRSKGIKFEYEKKPSIEWVVPSRSAKYTPDFHVTTRSGKVIIVESKGRFVCADRQKMILVKKQHPQLDIRMVFSNSKSKISKQSPTTLGMWCDKHGFQYADKIVPQEWLDE